MGAGSNEFSYSGGITGLLAAASASDVLAIGGGATRITEVRRVVVTGQSTGTTLTLDVQAIKRSTADTTGTQVAVPLVAHNSSIPGTTATCYVTAFTANPTAGTTVGVIASEKLVVSTTANFNNKRVEFSWVDGVTLNSTNEQVCINLNGGTLTGTLDIYVQLTQRTT